MPMAEATRRCPDLIRVAPRMSQYKAVSQQIFEVFREFTPLVEGLSLDEAFLDVTDSRALHGSGQQIAWQLSLVTTTRPSGFSRSDAILATSLFSATPTEAVRPVRSRMVCLMMLAIC